MQHNIVASCCTAAWGQLFKPGLALILRLNINTLFLFMYFYMAVCFKTLDKTKTSVDPEKISGETYSTL